MVDREARDKAAELVERLVKCEITNDEFVDNYRRDTQDRALEAIFWWVWQCYDDLHEHRLEGKYRPTAEGLESLSRCVLFLRSGLEYEWPDVPWGSLSYFLASVFSLGLLGKTKMREFKERGEFDAWPFLRRTDYLSASDRMSVSKS